MSVVHVVDHIRVGYVRCSSAFEIADLQWRAGHNVEILVADVLDPGLLPSDPTPQLLLDQSGMPVYRNVDAIPALENALAAKTRPGDVIVAHHGVTLSAACGLADRRVVAALHSRADDVLGYLSPARLAHVAQRTDHWVVWGDAIGAHLRAWLGIDHRSVTISGQPTKVPGAGMRELCGAPALLTAARVHPVKNHRLMLEAAAVLAADFPDLHWHMAGHCSDPSYLRALQGHARRLRITHRISWHGYCDSIGDMMRGSNAMVLASHSEGVTRAVQEAMALRVPTVMPHALATDLSHSGLPVTYLTQSPAALANAIRVALRRSPIQLAAAARWVVTEWSADRVLRDWNSALASAQTTTTKYANAAATSQ